MAAACNKADPLGENRLNPADRGIALAASSTLNRLELSNNKNSRCHKVPHEPAKIEACLLTMGARCLPKHSREVVVDVDAVGHRLHGLQEGRHFNAYYDDYCYLPLYAFVGDFPLWAQSRTAEHEAAHGAVAALAKIVAAIRKRCRHARIIVRGDNPQFPIRVESCRFYDLCAATVAFFARFLSANLSAGGLAEAETFSDGG